MKPHIHTITELAIFTAIAFIFSYIESLFPLPIPFPGIKLGLANLVQKRLLPSAYRKHCTRTVKCFYLWQSVRISIQPRRKHT